MASDDLLLALHILQWKVCAGGYNFLAETNVYCTQKEMFSCVLASSVNQDHSKWIMSEKAMCGEPNNHGTTNPRHLVHFPKQRKFVFWNSMLSNVNLFSEIPCYALQLQHVVSVSRTKGLSRTKCILISNSILLLWVTNTCSFVFDYITSTSSFLKVKRRNGE